MTKGITMLGSLLDKLSRPLLAAIFVSGGLDALRSPGGRTQAAAKLGLPNPEAMVRVNGAVMVGAGLFMATGRAPRLSALALAGSLVPTTAAGHAFWSEDDKATRAGQRIHFLKNLSLIGGLLEVASRKH